MKIGVLFLNHNDMNSENIIYFNNSEAYPLENKEQT